jgi:hypothetical protein
LINKTGKAGLFRIGRIACEDKVSAVNS